jgi:hypothetical protein
MVPHEVIKIKDKHDIESPVRYSYGFFNNHMLVSGLRFYAFKDDIENISFATSPVSQIWEAGDTKIFETDNSIYWLVPLGIAIPYNGFANA